MLLDALPNAALRDMLPRLELVEMTPTQELYAPGEDIHYVYFPVSGLCSLVARSQTGAVDVGPIGFDGMVGLPAYLGAPTGPLTVTVHVAAQALRQHQGLSGVCRQYADAGSRAAALCPVDLHGHGRRITWRRCLACGGLRCPSRPGFSRTRASFGTMGVLYLAHIKRVYDPEAGPLPAA